MIRTITSLVFLSLTCFSTLASQQDASESIDYKAAPEWVKPAKIDIQSNAVKAPEISVRYLLSDQQYNIATERKSFYYQVIMQPINENGLQHVAEVSFSFNPKFEKLNIHHIQVTRDGKTTNRLVPEQIKILNEDASLKDKQVNGRVTALAILEDIRVDDIISYAYSIDGSNPVLGEKHFGRFATSWGVTIEQLHLRLISKNKSKLNFGDSQLAYKKNSTSSFDEYIWHAENTTAAIQEDRIPSWFTPYGFIEFSEFQSWKQVNDWAIELYQDRTLSNELSQKIAEWNTNLKSTDEKIAAALRFVQDEIRYFGIEMGQNTHRPFSPETVFNRRYGDCKDKTTLLITILEQFGLKAYPALVSSYAGKVLDRQTPSPGAFDHVIVKLEYDSKDYWLDGTMSHQRGGLQNIGFIDYEQALVIKKTQNKLTKIVPPENSASTIETNEIYHLNEGNDPTLLSVETTYQGLRADSLRVSLASNGQKALAENFLNFYSQTFPKILSKSEFKIEDDTELNKIKITSEYTIEDWTVSEAGKKIVSVYVAEIRDYLPSPTTLVRQYPFYVAHNVNLIYQQTIRSNKAKPLSYDDTGSTQSNRYFNYSKQIKSKEGGVTISHHFEPKTSFVEASQTADYVEQINQLKNQLGFVIIYPDNNGKPLKQQDNKLRNLAKRLLNKG